MDWIEIIQNRSQQEATVLAVNIQVIMTKLKSFKNAKKEIL